MKSRFTICQISMMVLVLACSCADSDKLVQDESDLQGSIEKAPMGKSVSYWDLLGNLNKIENINMDLIPFPDIDGSLPRKTGDFSLGMELPKRGQKIRDMEILMLQEKGGNRRIRLFSRNAIVYRISMYTKKKAAVEDRDVSKLFARVREIYGEPDKEIENQMIYVDLNTVIIFKSGGIYWIVEMQDIDRGTFSEDVLLLIDRVMQRYLEH